VTPTGIVIFCSTRTVASDPHPLLVSVTIKVYTPGMVAVVTDEVELNPFGPVHWYDTPVEAEPPVRTRLDSEQVSVPNTAGMVFTSVGTVVFCNTSILAEDEQPFAILDSCSSYMPGSVTTGMDESDTKFAGPVHLYLTSVDVVVAVNTSEGFEQVITPEPEALMVKITGALRFCCTTAASVVEQPVPGFVTVTT
jgi:hypothetical protein